jgi:Na+-driven multidrug efflux pump
MSENHYSIGDDKEKKIKKSFDASKIITLLIGLISIILFFRFIIYLSKG